MKTNAEGLPYASPPSPAEKWHFLFAPYGWLSSIDAETTINGIANK